MWREKNNALAAGQGCFDMLPALAALHFGADLFQRSAPYPRQLDDALTCLVNGLVEQGGIVFFIRGEMCLTQVFFRVCGVLFGHRKCEVAEQRAQAVQPAERQTRQKTKDHFEEKRGHRWSGELFDTMPA